MADRIHDAVGARQQEREILNEDPAVAATGEDTNHSEPLDDDNIEHMGGEKEFMQISSGSGSGSGTASEKDIYDGEKRPDINRTKSYATDTSVVTGAESQVEAQKRPWYKKVNPLRWGSIPPVPEEREVCREYGASFFSLVYFQWVAPIMSVRISTYCAVARC